MNQCKLPNTSERQNVICLEHERKQREMKRRNALNKNYPDMSGVK